MNSIIDHQEFCKLFEAGKLSIGVDPAAARRLFTETRMSSFRGTLGESVLLECTVITTTFYLALLCIPVSFYFAYRSFGWWSIAVIPVSAVLLFYNHATSSAGRPGLLLAWLALAFLVWLNTFESGPVYRWLLLAAASNCLSRTAYRLSSFFVRSLVIRSPQAFSVLRSGLTLRED